MEPHLSEEDIILLVDHVGDKSVDQRLYDHLRGCETCLEDLKFVVRNQMALSDCELSSDWLRSLVDLGIEVPHGTFDRDNAAGKPREAEPAVRKGVGRFRVAIVAAVLGVVAAVVWYAMTNSKDASLGAEVIAPIRAATLTFSNRSLVVIPGTERLIKSTNGQYRSGVSIQDKSVTKAMLDIPSQLDDEDTTREVLYWSVAGFLVTGQFEAAHDAAEKSEGRFPDDVELVTLSALAAYFDGDGLEAERILRSIYEEHPEYSVAALNLTVVLIENGDHAEAAPILNRIMSDQPGTPLGKRAEWLLTQSQ